MNLLALGMPGPMEWVLIFGALLLVFGARRLPELAQAMGKSITEFKKGLKGESEVPPESPQKLEDKDRP